MKSFLRDYALGLISLVEIKREYSLQIKKTLDWGIEVTHLDSHHHIHFLPGINRIVCELAKEYHVSWIRGSQHGVQSYFKPTLIFNFPEF